jgi:predicted PurR-regulated permease PerM
VDAGQQVLTTTLSILTVIVMTAYLLIDMPRLERFANMLIPAERKDEATWLFQSLTRVVGGYLRGQAVTSLSIGVYTFAVLSIAGAPNPLAFAVLAAFADVIPIIGAFIAILPPVLATLPDSWTTAVAVLVALLVYQQFEDRYLIPRVYGQTLNLPPIIVLFAVLAGAELLGIIGVLLALPFAAAVRVAMDYMIENRRLPLVPMPGDGREMPPPRADQPLAPDPPRPVPRDEAAGAPPVGSEAADARERTTPAPVPEEARPRG